jgi:hypothetical protein
MIMKGRSVRNSYFTGALFLCLFTAFSLHTAQASSAPHFSAADLLKMCTSTSDVDYGICAGYINAVSDIMLTESVANQRACKHDKVRSQQGIDIFTSYAEIFAEELPKDATAVIAAALARGFPCPAE